jgi:serine/threonine protein kinase
LETLQPSVDRGSLSGPFGRLDPSLPQVFGRYLLVQRLSRGGMGEIFLAKHGLAGFEKLAVIKKVLPHLAADEQFISRFVDEAQVAIKLQHVNVAQVFEVGRVGDEYFLALEYIDGRDLRRTFALLGHRRRRMPADLALFVTRELANGLAYAHRRTASDGTPLNLVHCDISPPNVLVSFEGETKVIDFGIAKSAMRGTATDPKVGFGKFGYMAPEQLIRGGAVDHRTDLYAAGVVLYELLTGARLYEAGPEPDYRALARKVARGEHKLPSQIDPSLARYDDLVAVALRPKPEARYQSAAELRDAIQQHLVAVNPTISTDQLGAYMRELFADEMAAQSELHERVASAHLSDFHEQFHTQTIATVSFALAEPARSPDSSVKIRRPATPSPVRQSSGRSTGPTPVVRSTGPAPLVRSRTTGPSPVLDHHSHHSGPNGAIAPPSHSLPSVDGLASDGLISDDDSAPTDVVSEPPPRGRRALVITASAALASLAIVAVWAVATKADPVAPPAPAAPVAAQRTITVEPLAVAPAPSAVADDADDPASGPPPSVRSVKETGREISAAPAQRAHRAREASSRTVKQTPQAPPFTRAQLGQKFQQVRREYDDYKAKFGSRLEREWGELATFIQYMPSNGDDAARREAARKLDQFRVRMRE